MFRLVIPVYLLFCSVAGFATTVYKTVDENGAVSFSDKSSAEDAEVLKVSTPPPQAPEEYIANLEAMRETTDRMARDRREREKHRAELKEIAARDAAQQAQNQPIYTGYYPGYSGAYRYRGRPPYRPGFRPKPEHPIAHPPLRSDPGPFRPLNSQLMRPMLPSSR